MAVYNVERCRIPFGLSLMMFLRTLVEDLESRTDTQWSTHFQYSVKPIYSI
jgi:hypothetical protein